MPNVRLDVGIALALGFAAILLLLDNRYAMGQRHQLEADMQKCLIWRGGSPDG